MSVTSVIDRYVSALLVSTIVVGVVLFALIYYFTKVKKMVAKEEHPNYDRFVRKNALDYAKFDCYLTEYSNKDDAGNDMDGGMGIVQIKPTVFVGGMHVQGYNFRSASAEEKKRTIINSIAFSNIIKHPMQMRQTTKSVDISYNINIYTERAKEYERKLLSLDDEQRMLVKRMEEYVEDPETYSILEERLLDVKRRRVSVKWMYDECMQLRKYMGVVSDVGNNAQKINQIMFSYVYNPNDYVQELSKEEIRLKAFNELKIRAEAYSSALENCGCTCKVIKRDEQVNLVRKHFHPYTAEKIRLQELLNSSYTSCFITSDSIKELEKERIGEELYELEMEQLNEEYQEALEEADAAFTKEYENVAALAQNISGQLISSNAL